MKVLENIQFGTILEVVLLLFGLYHANKASKDREEMEEMLNDLEKNSKLGPIVKAARPFLKINVKGWDDEVLYDEALGEINPEQRFAWYDMIYNIAVKEPALFDNFINYLAHLPKERRVKVLLELLENCKTKKDLKKIIIARSAHDPNASGMELIKLLRKWFVKFGKKRNKNEPKFVDKITHETKEIINEVDADMSGFAGWATRLKERAKRRYEENKRGE